MSVVGPFIFIEGFFDNGTISPGSVEVSTDRDLVGCPLPIRD